MAHHNIEIKARCENPGRIREILRSAGADFRGEDHQVDTYFRATHGRLKLRQGQIENSLIHYARPDQPGPKPSEVILYHTDKNAESLRAALDAAMGVLVVVDKIREIYFIENVKFHIDKVSGLGSFVEIEAIDADGTVGLDSLQEQCEHYMALLGIDPADLENQSYSDMLHP